MTLTPVLYTSVNFTEATGILSQAISTLPLLYVEWHHTSQLLHWSCQKALVYFFQSFGLHMFLFRVDSFLSTSKPESDCHKPTTSGSRERLKQGRKTFVSQIIDHSLQNANSEWPGHLVFLARHKNWPKLTFLWVCSHVANSHLPRFDCLKACRSRPSCYFCFHSFLMSENMEWSLQNILKERSSMRMVFLTLLGLSAIQRVTSDT